MACRRLPAPLSLLLSTVNVVRSSRPSRTSVMGLCLCAERRVERTSRLPKNRDRIMEFVSRSGGQRSGSRSKHGPVPLPDRRLCISARVDSRELLHHRMRNATTQGTAPDPRDGTAFDKKRDSSPNTTGSLRNYWHRKRKSSFPRSAWERWPGRSAPPSSGAGPFRRRGASRTAFPRRTVGTSEEMSEIPRRHVSCRTVCPKERAVRSLTFGAIVAQVC